MESGNLRTILLRRATPTHYGGVATWCGNGTKLQTVACDSGRAKDSLALISAPSAPANGEAIQRARQTPGNGPLPYAVCA